MAYTVMYIFKKVPKFESGVDNWRKRGKRWQEKSCKRNVSPKLVSTKISKLQCLINLTMLQDTECFC